MFREPRLDVLDLQLLPKFPAELDGLITIQVKPLERLRLLDDRTHLLLDPFEVVFADRLVQLEIVVVPVGDSRPECQANAGKKPHHRTGHHVGTTVPHHAQGLGITVGQQLQRNRIGIGQLLQRTHRIDDHSVDLGCHRRPRQPLADSGRDVQCRRLVGMLLQGAVGKLYLDHRRLDSLRSAPGRYERPPHESVCWVRGSM